MLWNIITIFKVNYGRLRYKVIRYFIHMKISFNIKALYIVGLGIR